MPVVINSFFPPLMVQDESNVLGIMLQDKHLHIVKDEKMLWFCIQEKLLSSEDIRKASLKGEGEAIVEEIHSQLATLACKMFPSQQAKLFKCFQVMMRKGRREEKE